MEHERFGIFDDYEGCESGMNTTPHFSSFLSSPADPSPESITTSYSEKILELFPKLNLTAINNCRAEILEAFLNFVGYFDTPIMRRRGKLSEEEMFNFTSMRIIKTQIDQYREDDIPEDIIAACYVYIYHFMGEVIWDADESSFENQVRKSMWVAISKVTHEGILFNMDAAF